VTEPDASLPRASRVRNELVAHLSTPLYRNGYALAMSGAATSALGIVYWMLAARLLPAEDVGEGSAAVATMILLSGFSQLNFRSALNRFLPVAGDRTRRLILTAYGFSLGAGLLLVFGFAFVVRSVAPSLAFLFETSEATVGFWIAVSAWSIFVLQDSALTGFRMAVLVPVENAVFSVAKIVALVALAAAVPAAAVFGSWFIAALLVVVPVNILLFRRLIPRNAAATRAGAFPLHPSTIGRFVTGDYVGSVFVEMSTSFLPAMVISIAGSTANAYFYMAWQIAYSLNLAIASMTTSLTVEASASIDNLAPLARAMLRHILRLFVPIVAVVILVAPLILGIIGQEYAEGGATTLRLLALAAVPFAVNAVFISVSRVRRRTRDIIVVQAAICVLVLGLSFFLLPSLGIAGVGVAWLAGQGLVCLALLATGLRSVLRVAAPGEGAGR